MKHQPYDPDVGKRVIQCACSRARSWTGRADALAAGWGSRWVGDVRIWSCPECYTPPVAALTKPNLTTPDRVLAFARGSDEQREQVRADIARLIEIDPDRGRAWSADVLAKVKRSAEWTEWAARLGLAWRRRKAA